jgi:hypothetical protein
VDTDVTDAVVLSDAQDVRSGMKGTDSSRSEKTDGQVGRSRRSPAGARDGRCPRTVDEAGDKSTVYGSARSSHLITHLKFDDVNAAIDEVSMWK